jgi:hypothetical protein
VLAAAPAAEGTPISHVIIARIWHRFDVQPWRTLTFTFSPDRQLRGQIREVVGLYLHPPERAGDALRRREAVNSSAPAHRPTLPVRPGHPKTASALTTNLAGEADAGAWPNA